MRIAPLPRRHLTCALILVLGLSACSGSTLDATRESPRPLAEQNHTKTQANLGAQHTHDHKNL